MSENQTVSVQIGPGLPGCVFLVFLVLKLTGYIDWSWWWVTAPLWGGLAIVLGLFLVVFCGAAVLAAGASILCAIQSMFRRGR